MRHALFALAALLVAAPAHAEQPSYADAERLLAGLAGEWRGALGYRDYQSNELFELPVTTRITVAEDGRTQHRVSRYDEGEGQDDVFIISLAAFDPKSGRYETAGFRADRAMSITRETVRLAAPPANATHWTLVFTERSEDDDRPADIRITLTRNGDSLMSVKEVDDLTDSETRFAFRNQTRLTRVR